MRETLIVRILQIAGAPSKRETDPAMRANRRSQFMRAAFSIVLCLFASALPCLASAAISDRLRSTFEGNTLAGLRTLIDSSSSILAAEGDIVFWNGRYVAFYRETHVIRDDFGAGPEDVAFEGIMRAESTTGADGTFVDTNWVIKPTGRSSPFLGCGGAYQPSVLIDSSGGLHMVYEARNLVDPSPSRARSHLCEGNNPASNQYVAYAHSTDGGLTFTRFEKLIWSPMSSGGCSTNVGTPEIQYVPGEAAIEVSYHQYTRGGCASQAGAFTRRQRVWRTSDPYAVHAGNYSESRIFQIVWDDTGTPLTSQRGAFKFDVGPGKADIVFSDDGVPGTPDYYMVMEAFGDTPDCSAVGTLRMSIVLARSSSIRGPWRVSPTPLIGEQRDCRISVPNWWQRGDSINFIIAQQVTDQLKVLARYELIEKVVLTQDPTRVVRIQSLAAGGNFVSAGTEIPGALAGLLRARSVSADTNSERFRLIGDCAIDCAIQSLSSGLFLSTELGAIGEDLHMLRARASAAYGWERFRFEGDCAVSCVIRSLANNMLVSTELGFDPATDIHHLMLRARAVIPGAWEQYRMTSDCGSTQGCGMLAHANGLHVTAELGYPGSDYGMLRARSPVKQAWQKFLLVGDCVSTFGCAIQSQANNLYVAMELGYGGYRQGMLRARGDFIGAWERFRTFGDCGLTQGCALLSLANGLYVSSEIGYGGDAAAMMRARAAMALGWEIYRFY